MGYIKIIASIFALIVITEGTFLSSYLPKRYNEEYCQTGKEDYDGLRVTFKIQDTLAGWLGFGPDMNNLRVVTLTKDETAATCVSAKSDTQSATYNGFRREIPGDSDHAVNFIYDIQGSIAGIQALFPHDETKNQKNKFQYSSVGMFQNQTIDGKVFYVLTAYFVDPSTICTVGRSPDDVRNGHGTVVILSFQNGTDPSNLIIAPTNRLDAIKGKWANNQCFPGMGQHTFYGMADWESDDCNTIVPVFLLFNMKNYLIGFGFDMTAEGKSKRFERPPAPAVQMIVGKEAPQCLLDGAKTGGAGATTMHVFFLNRTFGTCLAESATDLADCAIVNHGKK